MGESIPGLRLTAHSMQSSRVTGVSTCSCDHDIEDDRVATETVAILDLSVGNASSIIHNPSPAVRKTRSSTLRFMIVKNVYPVPNRPH